MNPRYAAMHSLLGGILLLPSLAAHAQEKLVLPDDLSAMPCSAQQLATWDEARADQLGARGFEPSSGEIGFKAANKYVADDKWEIVLHVFFPGVSALAAAGLRSWWMPITGQRETVCGNVARYERYDGGEKELDWCLYLIPDRGRSLDLVQQAKANGKANCGTDEFDGCVESEVTSVSSLHDGFQYFPNIRRGPGFPAPQACAHGPFVADRGHDNHPEIHPSQLLWWREDCPAWDPKTCAKSTLNMLIVQDDSDRYDDTEDFLSVWVEPPGWRPWAQSPVVGEFHIPVRMPPWTAEAGLLFLFDGGGERVSTASVGAVRLNGPTLIERNGSVLYRAGYVGDSEHVRWGFENACWDGKTVRAYLRVSAAVGEGDSKGYQLIKAIPVLEPRGLLDVHALGLDVLRTYSALRTEKLRMLADLVVTAGDGPSADATVESAGGEFRSTTRLTKGAKSGRLVSGVIRGVPVDSEFTISAGEAVLAVPGAKLEPRIVAVPDRKSITPATDQAVHAFAEALHVAPDVLVKARLQVVHIGVWDAAVVPWYVPVVGGRIRPEDGGKIADQLNQGLTTRAARTEDSDSRQSIFRGEWAFKIGSGTSESTSLIEVRREKDPFGAPRVRVRVRPDGDPSTISIRATFRGEDNLGTPVTGQETLSRYALSAESSDRLTQAITEIVCGARKCDGQADLSRTRAGAAYVSRDLLVTSDELVTLLTER